ncbi:MAG TPA: hypothetical protein VGN39_03220, partial [Terriglobales bacterium]|nr:hypothetical protein [Terriglobales bacterium]
KPVFFGQQNCSFVTPRGVGPFKPIGSSNPRCSASKSLKLNEKICHTELYRHFRGLATAVAGVGH